MERFGMKRVWAELQYRDHLNPHPGPEAQSKSVMALAYDGLGLSINSLKPEEVSIQVPENALEPRLFSRGWQGALRIEEKAWLYD